MFGRRKQMAEERSRAADAAAARARVPPLAARAEAAIQDELTAVKDQLRQAQGLVRDAVSRLDSTFSTLDRENDGQRELIQTLTSSLTASDRGNDAANADQPVNIQNFAAETSDFLATFTDLLANVSTQSVRTVYRIDDMARELEAVFKLVASIDEIAEETFILAVNATIEAAHAGAAGRSFAVIASNVRDLAQKTQRFNDQIGSQVGTAQTTIAEVRQIMAELASRDVTGAMTGKERITHMFARLGQFDHFVTRKLSQVEETASRVSLATAEASSARRCETAAIDLMASAQERLTRVEALSSHAVALSVEAGEPAGAGYVRAERAVEQALGATGVGAGETPTSRPTERPHLTSNDGNPKP